MSSPCPWKRQSRAKAATHGLAKVGPKAASIVHSALLGDDGRHVRTVALDDIGELAIQLLPHRVVQASELPRALDAVVGLELAEPLAREQPGPVVAER
jgi:hypothetical protein